MAESGRTHSIGTASQTHPIAPSEHIIKNRERILDTVGNPTEDLEAVVIFGNIGDGSSAYFHKVGDIDGHGFTPTEILGTPKEDESRPIPKWAKPLGYVGALAAGWISASMIDKAKE